MKRRAEGIALLSLYNDEDDEEEEEAEEEAKSLAEPARSGQEEAVEDEGLGAAELPEPDVAVSNHLEQNEPQEGEARAESDVQAVDRVLAEFLPPPPTTKCSDELQTKLARYVALKDAGRSFNEELRNSKGYRNPDFLQHAVVYQGVDQIGSCFKKEVFDPHGYPPEDFYQAIAAEQKREFERREQERKQQQNQRVEFRPATIPDIAMIQRGPTILPDNAVKPEGRVKKSKWDKVDPVVSLPQSAAAAQAALLSAASLQNLQQNKGKEEKPSSRSEKSHRGKSDRNRS